MVGDLRGGQPDMSTVVITAVCILSWTIQSDKLTYSTVEHTKTCHDRLGLQNINWSEAHDKMYASALI